MRVVTSTGVAVFLTDHAVERWHERCRPAKDRDGALRDLVQLVAAVGVLVTQAPVWLGSDPDGPEADAYLMVGDDITLPVSRRSARTCIVAGEPSSLVRQQRSQRRALAAAIRQGKRGAGRTRNAPDAHGRVGAGARKRGRGRREEGSS